MIRSVGCVAAALLVTVAAASLAEAHRPGGTIRVQSTFVVPNLAGEERAGVLVKPDALYAIREASPHLMRTDARGRTGALRQFDRLVKSGSRDDSGDLLVYDIEASARWLVVGLRRLDSSTDLFEPHGITLQVARRDGRARTLLRCRRGDGRPLALRGSLLAYRSCGGRSVMVRDLDRPHRVVRLPARAETAQFAGPRIVLGDPGGFGEAGGVSVFELAGAERVLAPDPRYGDVATREDGTVLLLEPDPGGDQCAARVQRLDPGADTLRALPFTACTGSAFSLRGDQLVHAARGTVKYTARSIEGGPPLGLRTGRWELPEAMPGGRVRLEAEGDCFAFAFVPLSVLLDRGPAPPPRCAR